MDREGQFELRHLELARGFVEQLLQGAERAEPAAEHAASPEQDAGGGEGPEDEQHRVDEEQFPTEAFEQRMDEGQHVDHRQLPQAVPADIHQGEQQVATAQPVQQLRPAGQVVLQEENHGEQAQGAEQHADLEALLVPDA
ncbi:hypothetical protein D3C78_1423360 [compost metagenome]